MKNSKMLLQKGEKFYKLGKLLCKVLIGAVVLFVITLLLPTILNGRDPVGEYLTFTSGHPIILIYVTLILSYLGILVGAVGPVLYFNGLNLIGLGQIAENTDKE